MHVNVGPWASLFRALPVKKVLAIGVGVSTVSLGLLFALPMPVLRWVGPLLAVALCIGGGALLVGAGRAVWAGGRAVRIVSASVLGLGLVAGELAWYTNWVAREAHFACRAAAEDPARWYRDESLARCKARVSSVGFAIAKQFHDLSQAEVAAYAQRARNTLAIAVAGWWVGASAP